MATPAERFTTGPASDDLLPEPTGAPPEGQLVIEPHVTEGGMIAVAGETFSVERHLAYRIVTIAVDGRIMYVYADGTLIKTLGRDTAKPIRQTRTHRVTRRTKGPRGRVTDQPESNRNASTDI